MWSQRDNFVSVPTDCPQRDERLGWTGDAQAFAATASTLFDAESFWRSWLRDLALEQDPTLGVPTVVPDVVIDGEPRFGRAGWADAAAIVPWAVYEAYGDASILATQLESMAAWVDALARRRGSDGLLPPSMQFGDWLDPDAPSDRPWEAKADSTYIANAFLAHSARLTADAARLTGATALEDRTQVPCRRGRGRDVDSLEVARRHDADRLRDRHPARGRARGRPTERRGDPGAARPRRGRARGDRLPRHAAGPAGPRRRSGTSTSAT